MFVYMRRLWGRIQEVKGTCAINLFVNSMRWRRKLIGHRHITERYVVLPHKHLRNASSSWQGDAQLTLAYDMMHDSPGETMSSYDEHVRCTIHCFNMGDSVFDSFWRDAE